MTFIIKQAWYHIEAIYSPHPANKFRNVLDIYVNPNSPIITVSIPEKFVDLRIYARNGKGDEIGFIEKETDTEKHTVKLLLFLNIDDFPFTDVTCNIPKYQKYKYAKIEISYTIIAVDNPPCRKYELKSFSPLKRALDKYIFPQVICKINLPQYTHPEFYLTLPLGWKIESSKDFQNISIEKIDAFIFLMWDRACAYVKRNIIYVFEFMRFFCVFVDYADKKIKMMGDQNGKKPTKLDLSCLNDGNSLVLKILISKMNEKIAMNDLMLKRPFISNQNMKQRIAVFLSDDGVQQFKNYSEKYKLYDKNTDYSVNYLFVYSAHQSGIVTLINKLPIFFIIISIIFIVFSENIENKVTAILGYAVPYLGYLYVYCNFVKEGYEILNKRILYLSLIFSAVLVIFVCFSQ